MASGWWDNDGTISGCVAAYQPIGATSLAASYSNLQNPGTYDAALGYAPAFNTATGWTFNGGAALTTGVVPASGYSVLVRFTDAPASAGRLIGARNAADSNPRFQIIANFASNTVFESGGEVFAGGGGAASGVLGIAGQQGYKNGSALGGAAAAWSAAITAAVAIGATGIPSGFTNFLAVKVQAFAIYSATLTAGEMATLTTRMNALPVASAKGLPIIAHYHHAVYGGG